MAPASRNPALAGPTAIRSGHVRESAAPSLRIVTPDIDGLHNEHSRELNVLFASVGCTDTRIITELLPRLADLPDVSLRAILDCGFRGQDLIRASSHCLSVPNIARGNKVGNENVEQEAAELCEWANLLVLGPIDAGSLAKMLHGHTDTLVLEIIRSWSVSKKIILVPGMSNLMWENPMTKKQLTKIRRKWNWIHVLQPFLWTFQDGQKKLDTWDAPTEELVEAVRNQIDLMNIGQGVEVSPSGRMAFRAARSKGVGGEDDEQPVLPPELWTMIIDFTSDWELAQHLHIYTNLPAPPEWQSHTSVQGPRNYMEALELTILRGNLAHVQHFIATHSVPRWLSKLCIRLIMRFAMTPLLAHLEANHKDLFWASFGHTFLPDKASSVFGRTEILEFWRTSPSFLTKEYNTEALDGASKAGFVNVLEWWQRSGLPLKFTEAALEQSSSQGRLQVLEWWKQQSTSVDDTSVSVDASKIRLKPGKSICYATQNGHTDVVRWWCQSGIPFPNEETVAKLASTHGHVDILQLWHEVKGDKVIFDNQVLVGATKMGNVKVLEWWKQSGLKVEYKTCDVEEALEDGDEGERGMSVRRWWARNGLNLGVGTSEWMKTKHLNA
ncbi:SIS2 protein (cycle-specific protein control) [Teratosphaeria destructans]|uniref:SIS2 protein (Cycle-specific protein control) n=1 Tax=Teratosphaeria destructans TaxID=418781 RepID=A0A9W7SSK0_9PEZI|nr:SIS2 protein (cycle-specific protein control) [Teratosphaeria destructans]